MFCYLTSTAIRKENIFTDKYILARLSDLSNPDGQMSFEGERDVEMSKFLNLK